MDGKTRDLTTSQFEGPEYDASVRPIWDSLSDIAARVPSEDWDKLPRDGARNYRRYLYGTE